MADQVAVLLLASGFSLVVLFGYWAWGMRHKKDISVTDAYYGFGPCLRSWSAACSGLDPEFG